VSRPACTAVALVAAAFVAGCGGSDPQSAPPSHGRSSAPRVPGFFDNRATTLGLGGRAGAPYPLLDLPGVGTVGWRCDRGGRYSLVFVVPDTATVSVRLYAGARRILARDVDPRQRLLGPYRQGADQTLIAAQSHEPGDVVARVHVIFRPSRDMSCQVLHTSLQMASRSHGG
jgi:hypothetical protein